MKLVGELSVSLPPFPEHHRIVAKVDHLMALCDELEIQLIKMHANIEQLTPVAV